MSRIAILGSGMAACGANYFLTDQGLQPILYEKNSFTGGHTASYAFEGGWIFDDGPHISFTKDKRIQEILARNVDQAYESIDARVNNYWQGHWIDHPAICNLNGLPAELLVNVLNDFVSAQNKDPSEITNYQDWLYASYGKTFADTFPIKYGLKYHTTDASNMSTDWLGPRLYRPDLEEVLKGVFHSETAKVHYITDCRYPTNGGFQSYLNPFLNAAEIRLNHEVTSVMPKEKTLVFSNGQQAAYDTLVSSIPLTTLIPMIEDTPADIVDAAGRLAVTSCVMVNLGVDRADLSENHWTYFYDDDFLITRISFPHMLSANNVPPGMGSIQCEIYFSEKYRPLSVSLDECIQSAIHDLRRCNILLDSDQILFTHASLVPFANIIFDLDRAEAVEKIHGYLDGLGILTCGRYGEWGYQWTDESFVSGEHAAKAILR